MTNFLAVYGTLRRRSILHKLPVAAARLQFFSCGLVGGRHFWQRTYPALIQDRGIAQVELFRIVDPSVLCDLDRYEGFDPHNPRASLFVRNQILLLSPPVRAWVYFLNRQIPRGTQQRERRINFTTETQRTRRKRKFNRKVSKATKEGRDWWKERLVIRKEQRLPV